MSRYQPRHRFSSGSPILSEALNDNFAELEYAINNREAPRPGNGVTKENLGRRSVPPKALENPYVLHTWGVPLRANSFVIGANNFYGIDADKTFHVATPDQDVRVVRFAGYAGINQLAGNNVAQIKFFVDGEDIGRTLEITEVPSHEDQIFEVQAGSKIEVKFVNTHNGKFVGGHVWLYARSLPWI